MLGTEDDEHRPKFLPLWHTQIQKTKVPCTGGLIMVEMSPSIFLYGAKSFQNVLKISENMQVGCWPTFFCRSTSHIFSFQILRLFTLILDCVCKSTTSHVFLETVATDGDFDELNKCTLNNNMEVLTRSILVACGPISLGKRWQDIDSGFPCNKALRIRLSSRSNRRSVHRKKATSPLKDWVQSDVLWNRMQRRHFIGERFKV